MAIIKCPSCSGKISDKAKVCSHCNYDLVKKSTADGLNEEQLASKKRIELIKRRYSLQMQAMIGIILVLGGSLMWYFGGRGFASVMSISGIALLVVGAALYLTTRVRLLLFKKSS